MGAEARRRQAGLVVDAPPEAPLERITRLARRYNEAARDGQPLGMLLLLHRDLARAVRAGVNPGDPALLAALGMLSSLKPPMLGTEASRSRRSPTRSGTGGYPSWAADA